jgi:hypothetical protein
MNRLIHLSLACFETANFGWIVKELWIGDMFHTTVSLDSYAAEFPELEVKLHVAKQLTRGGSLDKETLATVVEQLILQLNSGEITGIITTPAELSAFCELLEDFDILPNPYEQLVVYLIADTVAKRIS